MKKTILIFMMIILSFTNKSYSANESELTTLKKITLLSIINIGVHSFGHAQEGNFQNENITIDIRNFTEIWNERKTASDKTALLISGAGFRAQDAFVKFIANSNLSKINYLITGIYKLGYTLGFPQYIGAIQGDQNGDLEKIADINGRKNIYMYLSISGIADIYKSIYYNDQWELYFWQSRNGIPGLNFTTKF